MAVWIDFQLILHFRVKCAGLDPFRRTWYNSKFSFPINSNVADIQPGGTVDTL